MPGKRLPRAMYRIVQRTMPIVCVDLLPVRYTAEGQVEIGLITRRSTDGKRDALAMVGGRVLHGELLQEAIARHVHCTLGPDISWAAVALDHPDAVAEYAPRPRDRQRSDPRQHAIALTWRLELHGEPRPCGEARAFDWFQASAMPSADRFIPGHGGTVRQLLAEAAPGAPGYA